MSFIMKEKTTKALSNDSKNNVVAIIKKNGKQAVNARDLHAFLESKRDFSNWIKDRIEKYELIENVNYTTFKTKVLRNADNQENVTLNKFVERKKGASTRIEYALSLDCAKELCMIEGSEKGKEARKYFIECEKIIQECEENPKFYVERAINAYLRKGKSPAWIKSRFEGKEKRSRHAEVLAAAGCKGYDYRVCTNATYEPIFGTNANGIRKEKNLPKKVNLRDRMTSDELGSVKFSEMLSSSSIEVNGFKGVGECSQACYDASVDVMSLIEKHKTPISERAKN
jgi:phage anti-repressor protein